MAAETAVVEEFITIVPVGETPPVVASDLTNSVSNSGFVTVLTVGANAGAAEIIVKRPRGARLGLGLKFEGGSAAAEKVRKLLVQSCAEESPAAEAVTPWGKLIPGDEILAIDGVSVSELTRIDCVRRLKDSDEILMLLVRHFETNNDNDTNTQTTDNIEPVHTVKQNSSLESRPTIQPPPVPPRKIGKKNSFKDKLLSTSLGEQKNTVKLENSQNSHDKDTILINGHHALMCNNLTKLSRKSSFDSHTLRQGKDTTGFDKKRSPEEVRRLIRRLSDGKSMPPEADVYIDLLSSEWEKCLALADAESDDTGSSISTVVDKLGSMTNSVDNSIPSTPIMQPKMIDIQKVLNCIENIDSNILNDITKSKIISDNKLDKNFTNNIQNYNSVVNISVSKNNDTSKEFSKKHYENDRNNNCTIVQNKTDVSKDVVDKIEPRRELITEKPKPMPRSIKTERQTVDKKPLKSLNTKVATHLVPEPLLTPTKKNCIENWLQRSEAELNQSTSNYMDDNPVPEVLPRLIDFVPKPQFKECSENSVTRPKIAPPPPPTPPVEPREDGSGASLDTIGELDESCDTTDSVKPIVITNQSSDVTATYGTNYWEDRNIKSDAEEKNLSNDESPPPSCPRQPPDGVETPAEEIEKPPEPPSRLPPQMNHTWTSPRTRFSYAIRKQDARSEASVKDKIAMFSSDEQPAVEIRFDKFGTLPSKPSNTISKKQVVHNSFSELPTLDRRLTKSQDNLDEVPRNYKKIPERPEVLGGPEKPLGFTEIFNLSNYNKPANLDNKPLFYGSTTTLPCSNDKGVKAIYHARSISDDNGKKRNHTSNLEYLIEQRKKSMSKLKCLIIPETQGPIIDLPEIKVQDSFIKSFLNKSNNSNLYNKENNKREVKIVKNSTIDSFDWKTNFLPNNIPKYSPAFKRKSLQVYTPTSISKDSTPERKFFEKVEALNKFNDNLTSSKLMNETLEYNKNGKGGVPTTLPATFITSNDSTKSLSKEKKTTDIRDFKNVEIKICTATEIVDSDNDSAMSSTQSSYRSSASSPLHNLDSIESDSSRVSPRISLYTTFNLTKTENPKFSTKKNCDNFSKKNVSRSVSSETNVSLSSSAGSGATSGSQASCSSLESNITDTIDPKKVTKSYKIDTINRRNIVASARCRSGRDVKLKSPLVEPKFTHEPLEEPASPTKAASERFSSLTSSVSAITNKGDTRRRNKQFAETDSDSDSEVNIRKRKSDFKNIRLKRNLSASNKHKQNENNTELPKKNDISKNISEKLINSNSLNTVELLDQNKSTKEPIVNYETCKVLEPLVFNAFDTVDGDIIYSTEKVCSSTNRIDKISSSVPVSEKTDNKSSYIVRLQRGVGTGVGLILAGGNDCEAKDVTVHRVLSDSIAYKAGLKRGTKVRSINGNSMNGLTHAQSVAILKEQRSEILIEIENEKVNEKVETESAKSKPRPEISKSVSSAKDASNGQVVTVLLEKAGGGAGLGFGLDGGRDSPLGDRPLTIKKLFAGGAAAQSGRILVGAILLSAGGQSMESLTRTQAWAALKALPAGPVALVLRNPK